MVLTTVRPDYADRTDQQPAANVDFGGAARTGKATGPYLYPAERPAQVRGQVFGGYTALGSTARYLGAGEPAAVFNGGLAAQVTFAGQAAQVGSSIGWAALAPAIEAANGRAAPKALT